MWCDKYPSLSEAIWRAKIPEGTTELPDFWQKSILKKEALKVRKINLRIEFSAEFLVF